MREAKLSGGVWVDKRVLGSAEMLPTLSGILPDSFCRNYIRLTGLHSQHHPNRVHGRQGQHAGGSGQNAHAFHSFLFANFMVQPSRQ